jgi:hypothetical protein
MEPRSCRQAIGVDVVPVSSGGLCNLLSYVTTNLDALSLEELEAEVAQPGPDTVEPGTGKDGPHLAVDALVSIGTAS